MVLAAAGDDRHGQRHRQQEAEEQHSDVGVLGLVSLADSRWAALMSGGGRLPGVGYPVGEELEQAVGQHDDQQCGARAGAQRGGQSPSGVAGGGCCGGLPAASTSRSAPAGSVGTGGRMRTTTNQASAASAPAPAAVANAPVQVSKQPPNLAAGGSGIPRLSIPESGEKHQVIKALKKIEVITLFVEDLPPVKAFYQDVFGLEVVYQDDVCRVVGLVDQHGSSGSGGAPVPARWRAG